MGARAGESRGRAWSGIGAVAAVVAAVAAGSAPAVGLAAGDGPAPAGLTLEVVRTWGDGASQNDVILGSVSGVVESDAGGIFLADIRLQEIVHLGADGEVIDRYGKVGGGPGDLMDMFTIAAGPGGNLYVVGIGGRVEVLGRDFAYRRSLNREHPGQHASALAFDRWGRAFVAAVDPVRHTTVDVYEPGFVPSHAMVGTFAAAGDVAPALESTYAGSAIAVRPDGALVAVQHMPYLVRVFERDGKLIAETTAGAAGFVPEPPEPEVRGDGFFMAMPGRSSGVAVLADGRVLVSSYRRDEGATTARLCLYDPDLQLLGRRDFDHFVGVLGAASGGGAYVFVRRDDAVMVEEVQVEVATK